MIRHVRKGPSVVNRKPDARQRWLDAGLRVLAEEGAERLRIDRLAALLGVTKGSFHHHFDGADGFKSELLTYIEQIFTDTLNAAISSLGASGDARATMAHLTALLAPERNTLYRPELERAVRAWASWDSDVREMQARVDAARVSALQRVWRPHVGDDSAARIAALLPYLVAVGATVIVPAVTAGELQRVYETLLPLVPSAPELTPSRPKKHHSNDQEDK
jgi:AcrR family transcriptional regulator